MTDRMPACPFCWVLAKERDESRAEAERLREQVEDLERELAHDSNQWRVTKDLLDDARATLQRVRDLPRRTMLTMDPSRLPPHAYEEVLAVRASDLDAVLGGETGE